MKERLGRTVDSRRHGAGRTLAVLAAAGMVAGGTLALRGADPAAAGERTLMAKSKAGLDRSILEDPGRPEVEKEQDSGRKALEVYEWIGIEPGMVVGDLFCSGGYNTFLLSRVVGDKGKVYGVFEFYADKEAMDGRLYKVDVLRERVEKNGLDNVELLTRISELPAGSLDAVLIVRNYHDVEWVFPDLKRSEVVAQIHRALKPGGRVGIVEVATDKPGWDKETHRLNRAVVIEDFTAGGFRLEGESDLLANPDDDHATHGFDVGRYKMDRYLLKFLKPA